MPAPCAYSSGATNRPARERAARSVGELRTSGTQMPKMLLGRDRHKDDYALQLLGLQAPFEGFLDHRLPLHAVLSSEAPGDDDPNDPVLISQIYFVRWL